MNSINPFNCGPGIIVNKAFGKSYKVVKEVYENLDKLIQIYSNLDFILKLPDDESLNFIEENFDSITEILENKEAILTVESNIQIITDVYNQLENVQSVIEYLPTIEEISSELTTVAENINSINKVALGLDAELNSAIDDYGSVTDPIKNPEAASGALINIANNIDALLRTEAQLPEILEVIPQANAVSYIEQNLTEDQQEQARKNIKALTETFLINKDGSTKIGYQLDNGSLRTVADKLNDFVSVKDFGAKGDGITDDTEAIQTAMEKAQGRSLYIPAGKYILASGSITIFSNTHVYGDGWKNTQLIQKNYYTYSGAWNRKDAVDWNVFQIQPGSENILIENLGIFGPFTSNDYSTNPVQNFPYSNGILCRGRDYQDRKELPLEGENKNIFINNILVEGFAEDGIQLDNVTDSAVTNCKITRCGRGGVRVYGGLRVTVAFNSISYLYPGDKLNSGNRMYGVTFTRVYKAPLSDFRQSKYCTAAYNKISNSPYWKGLDTHGGVNIDFVFNQIEECHIGIGVDKGGYTEEHGIASPANIKVIGNTLIRTLPDDPNEGDGPKNTQYAFASSGINIVAHDSTDEYIGKNIIVSNNYLYGWGEDIRFGAVTYSNWIGVLHYGNIIKHSRRDAICLFNVVDGIFTNDFIDDIRPSSLNVQNGIDCASTTINAVISGVTFINRQETTLTAVNLTQNAEGYTTKVGLDLKFEQKGIGGITKVNRSFTEDSLWSMRNLAAGFITNTGVLSAGKGITSVNKIDTGSYEITLNELATAKSSLWPVVTPVTSTQTSIAQAYSSDTNKINVTIKNKNGTAIDSGFYIQVNGY